ncbi:MAG: hypothetical protein U0228_05685 [Myxococcaceae bacterium]
MSEATTATPTADPQAARFALMGFITSGLAVVLSMVRSKLVAVEVGPVGVGIVAEVTQLLTFVGVIATVANSPALLKWISESIRDRDFARLERGVGTAIVLALGLSGVATLGCVIAGPWFLPSGWDLSLPLAIALTGASIAFATVASCITTVHVGFSDLRAITASSLLSALATTAILVALVLLWGLPGQFLAIALGAAASVVITALFLRRRTDSPVRLRLAWDREFARTAFTIGTTSLISGYVAQGLLSIIRLLLEREGQGAAGAELNGNFQAAYAIATTYFAAVLQGIGQYYFPRYAAARDEAELTREVHAGADFVLRLTPALALLVIAFRELVIDVLYSGRFSLAAKMLGFMLVSDLVKGVSWSYAGPLPMRGLVRAFLLSEAIGLILGVPVYYLAIHYLGPGAVGLGMLANQTLYLAAVIIIIRSVCGVRLASRHVVRLGVSLLLASGTVVLVDAFPHARWGIAAAVLAYAYFTGAHRVILDWLGPRLRKVKAVLTGSRGAPPASPG